MSQIKIIGIAGGSGSGKTTFARTLLDILGTNDAYLLAQDHYYFDQSHRFDKDGGAVNFDHPSSIDFKLLLQHLNQLKSFLPIDVPQYDFKTHKRRSEVEHVQPKKIILVDGTLIASQRLFDGIWWKLYYISCPEEIRFARRLERDVKERGRSPEGVKSQFQSQVKPMHDEFVEPSQFDADVVVNMANFDDELGKLISILNT